MKTPDTRTKQTRRTSYRTRDLTPIEQYMVRALGEAIPEALDRLLTESYHGQPRALDVGCGGQPMRGCIEEAGWHYEGFDAVAQGGITLEHTGLLDTDLPESLLKAEPYKLLIVTEVLEHVANWPIAFRNLARLLQPGGAILITVPHIYVPHEEPHDYWRPTSNAISHYASDVGLRVEKSVKLGSGWDVLGTILCTIHPWKRNRRPLTVFRSALYRAALSFINRGLISGRLQDSSDCVCIYPLNNLAILRKPN